MDEIKAAPKKGSSSSSLVIELTTTEENGAPVYIVGNFNDWQVKDEKYRLQPCGKGQFRFIFEDIFSLPEMIEYKYVRGDWNGEELGEDGRSVNNRTFARGAGRLQDFVPRWKTNGQSYRPELLPKIKVISEQFEIPQLIKTRRIAALLPHDYEKTERRYPVLYLQDGQNLFDDYAPYGNWAVDKKLALMAEKGLGDIIIIAIDHAEEERVREFTPSGNTTLGSGDGKKYVRFLADTLKPYVDSHFRTLPDRNNTGIGGSSMGGLISIYAGLIYPEVYGKLLIFSPSLWVAPNIHFHAMHFEEHFDMRIYIYGGKGEGANMVPNIQRFIAALEESGNTGNIEFKLSIDSKGQHNEHRWGQEFPEAVEWLFFPGEHDKE